MLEKRRFEVDPLEEFDLITFLLQTGNIQRTKKQIDDVRMKFKLYRVTLTVSWGQYRVSIIGSRSQSTGLSLWNITANCIM